MADICPEKIVEAGIIPLIPYHYIAGLNNIVFNVNAPILLRLLTCKDAINLNRECSYPDHINPRAVKKACHLENVGLAQIYFRHETIDPRAGSGIILFIEGIYLRDTDKLFDIYTNTLNWLNIAGEKPFLFVVCYGDPIHYNDISITRRILDQKLKPNSKYKNPCEITYANEDSESLLITHTKLFNVVAR